MENYFFVSANITYKIRKFGFLLLLASGLLTGCDSSKNTVVGTKASGSQYDKAATLSGVIRDQQGLVKNAKLKVTDFKGQEVAAIQLEGDARYSIEIPSGTTYPLLVAAYPVGKTKKEMLTVAVVSPALTKHDITPVSTAIAAKALSMGGYTSENLKGAAMSTIAVPGKKKTEAGFSGDPTKQYGGWH